MTKNYKVIVAWDDEVKVFYIVESEIRGLALEGATIDMLLDKISDAAGELVGHNHKFHGPFTVQILEQRSEPLTLVAA